MPAFHCELAWLGGEQPDADVAIEIAGERIVAVTPWVPAPAGAVRLPGLTLPGLANAHSHAFQRALRGRSQRGTGSFWTWRQAMYALAERIDPEIYHRLARVVFGEMLCAGITAVGEFHYLHHGPDGRPYADPNAMSAAVAAAAADAGIRLTILDTCYLWGGIGVEPDPTQRRFADRDAAAWAERVEAAAPLASDRCRIGAAVHSVRAVDPDAIATVAGWAAGHGAVLHAHVSEQPAENDQAIGSFGRTPCRILADAGAVGPAFTAVHGTHLTDADLAQLGEAGATVCLCPTTERDLADGIGPAAAMRRAGISLALGSDSHAVIDLFEDARAVELDERLASGTRGHHDAATLLRAATVNGHRAIGWPEAGRLEAGAPADFVAIDLTTLRTAGTPPAGALDAAVFVAGAADVRTVVVGGRVVVRDGRHETIDVARELGTAIRAAVGDA